LNPQPIAVALEPGPASFAALKVAADLAVRLERPLRGIGLATGAIPTLRVLRRLKLAGRRRGLDVSFVRPRDLDLLGASELSRDAALLVVGRSSHRGVPPFGRRLALGRLLRASGPPVLVVPRRGRPLGDRVLVACASGTEEILDPFYSVLAGTVSRLSILRYVEGASEPTRGLEPCLDEATSWDELTVHGDEGHALGDAVLDAADRMSPTLVAVSRPPFLPSFAALLAPEAADQIVACAASPVLVARTPVRVATAEIAA
jgi:nucleotide-binding universal stress UspA family protein